MSLLAALKLRLDKNVTVMVKGLKRNISGKLVSCSPEWVVMSTQYSKEHYLDITEIVGFWESKAFTIDDSPKPAIPLIPFAGVSGMIGPGPEERIKFVACGPPYFPELHDPSTYDNHDD